MERMTAFVENGGIAEVMQHSTTNLSVVLHASVAKLGQLVKKIHKLIPTG